MGKKLVILLLMMLLAVGNTAWAEDLDDEDLIAIVDALVEESNSSSSTGTAKKKNTIKDADASKVIAVTPYSGIINTNGGELNVRAQPKSQGKVLLKLLSGDPVIVTGTVGQWVQISAQNITGYVASKYVVRGEVTPDPYYDSNIQLAQNYLGNAQAFTPQQVQPMVPQQGMNQSMVPQQGMNQSMVPQQGIYQQGTTPYMVNQPVTQAELDEETGGDEGVVLQQGLYGQQAQNLYGQQVQNPYGQQMQNPYGQQVQDPYAQMGQTQAQGASDASAQYATMQSIAPVVVAIHSELGPISMYWAPSQNELTMRELPDGETVTAIAVNDMWVQVLDESTNKVGFILRSYVD